MEVLVCTIAPQPVGIIVKMQREKMVIAVAVVFKIRQPALCSLRHVVANIPTCHTPLGPQERQHVCLTRKVRMALATCEGFTAELSTL